MSKKVPSKEEQDLFREAVQDVRPLQAEPRHKPPRRKPSPRPRQRELDEAAVLAEMLCDPVHPEELETGEELLFIRDGLQHKLVKKLRRGELAIEAELDLHGLFREEAREAVVGFLTECRQNRVRCVRIIHGKGHGSQQKRPVLKQCVNHWLQQRDEVLAFCSARPVDGGTGAIYLLLKRG
ncbi:Smr/MutS family protein [Thiohalophilus sp.]|uniref:Smr/MutS family protein n=1 Tax=Thiohalophilus sp. TaxID=3028392 RepID=UPI002ACE511F|nr:Smr/MutS family protein [Thiohalophilus sp.]MDZ7805124.1 Smr/MutS family protein [Thiohalophilus sp.]